MTERNSALMSVPYFSPHEKLLNLYFWIFYSLKLCYDDCRNFLQVPLSGLNEIFREDYGDQKQERLRILAEGDS